jgi:hypothetical protein
MKRNLLTLLVAWSLPLTTQFAAQGQPYYWTTIAGWPGKYGTADGTNSDERFDNPLAIAVDAARNLYILD